MNLIATILVYAGLTALFLGVVSVVRPLTFIGIASRPHGGLLLLCGLVLLLVGVSLPASEKRIETRLTLLDEFVPAYQFAEFHEIRIKAPRDRVYQAVRDVTAGEIKLFGALTWIRRGGQSGEESILNAPPNQPILALALRTSFMKLDEVPEREIVLGTLVAAPPGWRPNKDKKPTPNDFKTMQVLGFALAAMNFRLEDAANGETLLTTETRVYATDASARRKFAPYWRVIYPGSALIRVMWLRAIRYRAEKMPG